MRIFGRASDLFIILLRATPHEFYTRLNDLVTKIDETSIERRQDLIEQYCETNVMGNLLLREKTNAKQFDKFLRYL